MVKGRGCLHSLACGYPVFLAPLVEKNILSPFNCLGTLILVIPRYHLSYFPYSHPQATTDELSVNIDKFAFSRQNVLFFVWFLSFSILPCCCVHQQFILFIVEYYSGVWLYHV